MNWQIASITFVGVFVFLGLVLGVGTLWNAGVRRWGWGVMDWVGIVLVAIISAVLLGLFL